MEQKGKAIVTALGAFFVMAFVQSLCLTAVTRLVGTERAQAGQTLVLGLSAVIVLGLIAWEQKLLPQPLLQKGAWGAAPGALRLGCCVVLGAAANCALAAGLSLISLDQQLISEYMQAVPMGKGAALGLELAVYCLLVPVMEETLFRGVILDVLGRAFPLWIAAGLECLIFAWGHGQLLWFLYALLMGAVLTLLRLRTGSLYAPVAFHMAFNGANYLQPWLYSAAGGDRQALWVLLAAGLAVALAAAVPLCRKTLK